MRIVINPKAKKHFFILILTLTFTSINSCYANKFVVGVFDPQRALADAIYQVDLGPRTLGSEAHDKTRDYIIGVLKEAGWAVESPVAPLENGQVMHNISAIRGKGNSLILLGAHYDSRFFADHDPDPLRHQDPVPGANDGASGVAVLLELARVLPQDLDFRLQLVFFDAEDNGDISGYDWIMGSRYFAAHLTEYPDVVVILDMVGDSDLNLYYEQNSDDKFSTAIWAKAVSSGYTQFIPEYKYRMLDDHIPFRQLGIPAVDIIDFDYPYWHTTQDTIDKISADSLAAVGNTLLSWLTTQPLP